MSEPPRANHQHSALDAMDEWVAEVCRELGLELADRSATVTRVLDLTADVAHGVARPAAPVTAFLVGLAAGSAEPGTDVDERVAELCRRFGERAKAWPDGQPGG
jgi:hypothetical protein